MSIHSLQLTFGTSRGRDTYGYTLVTLRDETGKAYRTCGGGYDMKGTVFGDWLQANYQTALRAIGARAHSWYSKANGYKTGQLRHNPPNTGVPIDFEPIYGMSRNDDTGNISLDGACGLSCMEGIAKLIGLNVRHTADRKGRTNGFIVYTTER
jgi:hypothetical protein